MIMLTRRARVVGSVVTVGAALAVVAATVSATPTRKGRADRGVVYFAVTRVANGKEYSAGNTSDKLFGSGAITYVIKVFQTPTGAIHIKAKPVTVFYSNGSLTGTATATLTPGPNGSATITAGKLTAAHGTGGQKGHSLTDTFHGTGSLTTGTYKISYVGTYR